MDKKKAIAFLFAIAKETKGSFESPAILLTMKDYAGCIFKSLVDMRTALLQNAAPERVVEIINTFHLEWLQAIQDVETFKRRFRDTPRETITKALEFTKECTNKRRIYFQKYIDEIQSTTTAEERDNIKTDLEIIEDMHVAVNAVLDEKLKFMLYQVDHTEYCVRVADEIDELLNWLDKLYDRLAIQFSELVGLRKTQLLCDLTSTLRETIKNISASGAQEEQTIATDIQSKQDQLHCAVRFNESTDFEITKLLEKLKVLEHRIERLKEEDSSAVMALQHKSLHLEEKLQDLENLKLSLFKLKHKQLEEIDIDNASDHTKFHIFDHLLPIRDRVRLVDRLVNLWNDAILSVSEGQSIISILSVADINEVFRDELGKFTVDRHGRKLYKIDGDDAVYQVNQHNELVTVNDDNDLVYFYDDCGRYYLNQGKERVYKAHGTASEYIINQDGKMIKLKEELGGTVYWYDHLGRYSIDKTGKNIYTEEASSEKYECDGLGNLIRIRSEESMEYVTCPGEPVEIEENKYLQREVGGALKKCLAEVVLRQPQDPILYLADGLEKYRCAMLMKQKRLQDEVEMMAERRLHLHCATSNTSYLNGCEGETTGGCDFNFVNYKTPKDF